VSPQRAMASDGRACVSVASTSTSTQEAHILREVGPWNPSLQARYLSNPVARWCAQYLPGEDSRHPDCELHTDSPLVSSRHCIITQSARDYRIEDLGSLNGTFVNGSRLSPGQPQTLRHGDVIRLGATLAPMTFIRSDG